MGPVCVSCLLVMSPGRIGVPVLRIERGMCVAIVFGDSRSCASCGNEVIVAFGREMRAWENGFDEQLARARAAGAPEVVAG